MKYSTLYLHVGWSKTGTSAIQTQVQSQHTDFLEQGVLYPQSLQWPDHSHHPFALAFNDIGGYQGAHTPEEVLEKLYSEMASVQADSVLISSELSPFYYANSSFKAFVESHFETVKVIFTVRPQSELLLSLFNQLIKDANIRYDSSLFTLAMHNLNWLNYELGVRRWSNVVGNQNLHVIPYSQEIVSDFLGLFSIPVNNAETHKVINPSLPTRSLALIQARGRQAKDQAAYEHTRNQVLARLPDIPESTDKFVLFSVSEQATFNEHFRVSNTRMADAFGFDVSGLQKSRYEQVTAIPPGLILDL